MDQLTLAENLSPLLVEFPDISLVYLFGSQVTGQVGPMSDYDVYAKRVQRYRKALGRTQRTLGSTRTPPRQKKG